MKDQKITPCIWFDDKAEEAANLYVSLFPGSKILNVSRYGDAGAGASGQKAGTVMTVVFSLNGQKFMGLNGGPIFKPNEAVSFMIECKDQKEVDHYWDGLTKNGGEESQCGWLTDKFGVSWQVVPEIIGKTMTSGDQAKADRLMAAVLEMKKPDVAKMEAAIKG